MKTGLLFSRYNDRSLLMVVLTMGFFSWLFGCSERKEPPVKTDAQQYQQADAYRDLRDQVLGLSPKDLNLPEDLSRPIAILMETGHPEAVATLVSVADGSSSLYFSNGGGIIGGGEHEGVRDSALAFLRLAENFSQDMKPAENFPLPHQGSVRFYIVTSNGIRTAEVREDDLGNMNHQLSKLFHKGHEVITGIREHSPK